MPKAHVTFPLFDSCRALLARAGIELDIHDGPVPEPAGQLLARLRDCDGLLCTLFDKIDRPLLAAAPRLRSVAQFGVGFNNIDALAAAELGIQVTNTPGVLTDATAEMAWALLLAAARRLGEGERLVRAGVWTGWEPGQMLGSSVTGATLGIIGAGRIGTRVAAIACAFNMNVLYSARRVHEEIEREARARRVELDALLAESDFISLHVPLTPETRHLIGPRELALMKPSAILINTARGPVVDELALLEALRTKKIAAAGLDVYENEPSLIPGLAQLENVVLAPHLGSATRETREKMGMLAAENLRRMLLGEPPANPVNTPLPRA